MSYCIDMDESSENAALINYFDNIEMIESSISEYSRDTSVAEKEITACPSFARKIVDNPVKGIHDFDKREEVKDKNIRASFMFENRIDSHPSTVDEIISTSNTFATNSGDREITEIFKIEESRYSPTAEREIIAGRPTASGIISNPVAFENNYDNIETKDKRVELFKDGVPTMSEREITAGPSTAGEVFKRTAFKQKATKESIKNAIGLRSRVPLLVIDALEKYEEADGASLAQIKAYIGEKYNVHVDVLKSQIKDYLKKCEGMGVIMKIRGANGADKYKIKRV